MYQNKCSKCGAEFETKNPKRVICPNCLYPDRKPISIKPYEEQSPPQTPSQEDSTTTPQPQQQPQNDFGNNTTRRYPSNQYQQNNYNNNYNNRNNYNNQRPQGGYQNNQGGYQRPYQQQQGGYQQNNYQRPYPQQGQGGGYNNAYQRPQNQGGYQNNQGGYQRPYQQQQGGYRQNNNYPRNNQGGYNNNRRPYPQQGSRPGGRFSQRGGPGGAPRKPKRPLLISKEQVALIEKLYVPLLPLPNPDVHEIIAQQINEDPKKVFFGINLVRQKLMLPKVQFTKRKIVVSPEQLKAIETLYAPLLPLPPIGCHKFISKQLKMDEWRVHVGIGIIRKQMELPRWNPDRDDAPEEFKKQRAEELAAQAAAETADKDKQPEEIKEAAKEDVKTEEAES